MASDSPLGARAFWAWWGVGLGCWAAALILTSPWDLAVSQAMVARGSAFGRLVLLFGELPGWLAVAFSVVVLILGRRPDSRLRRFRSLGWAFLLLAAINPLLFTQAFKFLWGRVRFVDLGPALAGYTAFYLPAGVGAGESFPSGHTAMALVLAPLPFFLVRRGHAMAGAAALGVVLAVGGTVACGRIVAGAHYLTDCLFAGGLAFLISAILVRKLP
jgi:membrane-associated phospholipid phosphatase